MQFITLFSNWYIASGKSDCRWLKRCTFSGNDKCTMERISALFTHLYEKAHEAEMFESLYLLITLSLEYHTKSDLILHLLRQATLECMLYS